MKTKLVGNTSIIFKNDFLDYSSGELLSPVETQNYFILQAADSYYFSDCVCSEHTQYCDLEITYVVYGSVSSYADNVCEKVEKGEAYLSFRGEKHLIESKNSARFQTIAVNFKNGDGIFKVLNKKYANSSSRKNKVNISAQITSVLNEFIADDLPFKTINLDALISEILVILARDEILIKQKFYDKTDLLPNLVNYIDKNYLTIFTLNELTDEFGYSYSYLCKIFKQLYGCTLRDYLNKKRMSYAKSMLLSGSEVNEVADVLHYTSPFNFTRAFKKEYGVCPSAYIKNKS